MRNGRLLPEDIAGGKVLIDFLAGKVGVAFTALTLIGALLVSSGSFTRETRRGELEEVVDRVSCALMEVDGLRGHVRLVVDLPGVGFPFELVITGVREGVQVVRISAVGRERAERLLLLTSEVNGGEFELRLTSPALVTILKREAIALELG